MSRKVHIALVGRETAPIYYGIYHIDPEQVILVCSSQTKEEADLLKKLLNKNQFHVTIVQTDPTDLQEIQETLAHISNDLLNEDDELTLNLIGGTKHWSLAFYQNFYDREKTAIYLYDQNNLIWDIKKQTFEPLYTEIDTDEYLELYKNPIITYHQFESYTEEDFEVMREIRAFRNKCPRKLFNEFFAVLPKDWETDIKDPSKSKGVFQINNNRVYWQKPGHVSAYLNNEHVQFNSPHAVALAFNSGWFELQVAQILSQWKHHKDIRVNCIFPLKKKTKNEVDIIVNTGQKLLFVECKTQLKNGTDVDKFSTVVKNYGGAGSKALFITDEVLPELSTVKCKESGILTYSLKGESDHHKLYELLDREMTNINK